MKNIKPIKSQQEYNDVFAHMVEETTRIVGITKEEAEKRMRKLFDSGELNGLLPHEERFQIIVDYYMTTPA